MLAFRGEAGGGGNDLKEIGHAKATAEVLQILNELIVSMSLVSHWAICYFDEISNPEVRNLEYYVVFLSV